MGHLLLQSHADRSLVGLGGVKGSSKLRLDKLLSRLHSHTWAYSSLSSSQAVQLSQTTKLQSVPNWCVYAYTALVGLVMSAIHSCSNIA